MHVHNPSKALHCLQRKNQNTCRLEFSILCNLFKLIRHLSGVLLRPQFWLLLYACSPAVIPGLGYPLPSTSHSSPPRCTLSLPSHTSLQQFRSEPGTVWPFSTEAGICSLSYGLHSLTLPKRSLWNLWDFCICGSQHGASFKARAMSLQAYRPKILLNFQCTCRCYMFAEIV